VRPLADAIAAARAVEARGLLITLDHLGENVTTLAEADAATTPSRGPSPIHARPTSTPSSPFPYFMRRLGERPANVAFILRTLLREDW
jgi:hypothetical protein